jgi:hypothetical protein
VSHGRAYSFISEEFFRLLGPDKTPASRAGQHQRRENFIGACVALPSPNQSVTCAVT